MAGSGFFCGMVDRRKAFSLISRRDIVWDRHHRKSLTHREQEFESALSLSLGWRKQSSRGVLKKRCSENVQQIYRRTPMPKCDFNKVPKQFYWNHTSVWVFSCKFAAYFRTPFHKNNSGWLLLGFVESSCTVVITTTPRHQRTPVYMLQGYSFYCYFSQAWFLFYFIISLFYLNLVLFWQNIHVRNIVAMQQFYFIRLPKHSKAYFLGLSTLFCYSHVKRTELSNLREPL